MSTTSAILQINQSNLAQLRSVCRALNEDSGALIAEDGIQNAINSQSPETWQIWLIGLTLVTLISVSAAGGIILLPLFGERFYNKALIYFVGLGVGSLSGSAIFHLLPEGFGLTNGPNHDYAYKSWVAISGIYLFFLVDKFLKFITEYRERKKDRVAAEGYRKEMGDYNSQNIKTPAAAIASTIADTDITHADLAKKVSFASAVISDAKMGKKSIASVAWMILFGDGLHNFIDGLSIGAAFAASLLGGISVAVAVLCEEFPHELGDVAILINSGMSLRKALFYNLASASTIFFGFFIGVLLGDLDPRISAFIFAFAGGMFLYIALASMVGEMNKKCEEETQISLGRGVATMALQTAGIGTGLLVMFVMSVYGSRMDFS